MTIPNAMIFAKTINLANTKLSPALLLHCGVEAAAAAPTLPPKTLARPREQTEQVALT